MSLLERSDQESKISPIINKTKIYNKDDPVNIEQLQTIKVQINNLQKEISMQI